MPPRRDGTLNWVVTNDPNALSPAISDGKPPVWIGGRASLNRGYNAGDPGSPPYLKREKTTNAPAGDVRWGPSSDHPGGKL